MPSAFLVEVLLFDSICGIVRAGAFNTFIPRRPAADSRGVALAQASVTVSSRMLSGVGLIQYLFGGNNPAALGRY